MVSVILDTNSVIAYINGDVEAAKKIELIPELLLPAIVIGEMAYGAIQSAHSDDNLQILKEFASICEIIRCGENEAYEYGKIKSELKEKGAKIPENDMWIAACAKTQIYHYSQKMPILISWTASNVSLGSKMVLKANTCIEQSNEAVT